MKGTAIRLINKLFAEKAKGDKTLENGLRVKLILKGIPVDKLRADTPDDPAVINKIRSVLAEFGVMA